MSSSRNQSDRTFTGRIALVAAILLVLSGAACRVRSKYDGEATTACMHEASAKDQKARLDGGSIDVNRACKDCCHEKGLDEVEPGPCECGKLGLDALLK